MKISTAELMQKIRFTADIREFACEHEGEFLTEQPQKYLNRLFAETGMDLLDICVQSDIDISYCYRIQSGARIPSRNTLLRISLGIGLDVEKVQHALRLYGKAQLDPRCFRDAIILFSLSNGHTLPQARELLLELGEETL